MGARSTGNHPTTTKADGHLLEYFRQTFGAGGGTAAAPPGVTPSGITATGGIISDYASGPTIYRAHVFTSSGTFQVSALSTVPSLPDTIEYLVVAGGGGGGAVQASPGYAGAGGGGAGGVKIGGPNVATYPNVANVIPVSVASYAVTIGAGGMGGSRAPHPTNAATNGSNSVFGYPSAITATGGGAGSDNTSGPTPLQGGSSGGSGGGSDGRKDPGPGGAASPNSNPDRQGYPGGSNSGNTGGAGGGGGAMGAGSSKSPNHVGGPGGDGVQSSITGTATYYAGGGGGGSYTDPGPFTAASGGAGGGGAGGPYSGDKAGEDAEAGTGGGGGGGTGGTNITSNGGNGGSGVVIVRYQIASVETAKATGGVISFYNDKTIHTFTSSGTFATTSDWPGSGATVEYVIVGGGGAGVGGGGGAGAYRTGTTPIGAHPVSTSIQVGAGGRTQLSPSTEQDAATDGTPSYFGTPLTSPGGGHGGDTNPHSAGQPGGSGGGGGAYPSSGSAGGTGSGDTFPGTIGNTPSNGWGYDGGNGSYPTPNPQIPGSSSGGGGGAGGAGTPAGTYPGSPGQGGGGMQLPTTFRNPTSSVGHPGPTSSPFTGADDSGKYWIAGGGGGGWTGGGGGGGTQSSPYAGAGAGGGNPNSTPVDGKDGLANSGSGGGGSHQAIAGNGGSGIVLIAYPT